MSKNKKIAKKESDSAYFLKLVLYLILGSQWLKITKSNNVHELPIPIGLLVGIMFASHDHFRIDRKIEYALLLVACFISFWLPVGIIINL